MPATETFRGFFSYARRDAANNPALVEALTVDLEKSVGDKLVNADFAIWRDATHIRTGEQWGAAIEAELRGSDILIVLFTPNWIQSDYCRKEYLAFEEIEAGYGGGSYVVPILARALGTQERHLASDQRLVYDSINGRQYFPMLVADFLNCDADGRRVALEEIADDIVGIIERRRELVGKPAAGQHISTRRRTSASTEYVRSVQDFEKVDFLSDEEIAVDRARDGELRGVYAQVDFVERLSIAAENGSNVVFSVRQAYLTLENHGRGVVSPADDLRKPDNRHNAFFVRLHDQPAAISVCIDPVSGKTALAEFSLPPSANENRLARIATVSSEVELGSLHAELRVSLDAQGLNLPNGIKVSAAKRSQITALIQEVARKRYQVTETGEIRRLLQIKERRR